MEFSPHLHVSMPHIEMLADSLVLLLPIFPLTSLGTIHGGLALRAVLELELRRCHGSADDAALRHDYCWRRVRVIIVIFIVIEIITILRAHETCLRYGHPYFDPHGVDIYTFPTILPLACLPCSLFLIPCAENATFGLNGVWLCLWKTQQ